MKIKLYIADAQKAFSEQDCKTIRAGIKRAEKYAVPKLQISKDLDIIVTSELPGFIIPEDNLGARTFTGYFIIASFIQNHIDEDLIYEVICHEMCHAARWQRNEEYMKNLFDGMILEGLAVVFEEQAVIKQPTKQFFLQTMLKRTDEENAKILKIIKDDLFSKDYDYYSIFYSGDKKRNIPRWSGYSVGYYLVKKYLAKTGKTIEEAFAEPFDNFRVVLD